MERIITLALPCYVANATPVVTAKLLRHTHPLDFGLYFLDGRRLLGDSKSVEGFISGVAAGILTGYLLSFLGTLSIGEAAVLSFGTMLGDAAGSFVKRRLGLPSGAPAPLLDQLSFLVVALALYSLVYGFVEASVAVILILATPPIHLATNAIAYKLKLKSKPW